MSALDSKDLTNEALHDLIKESRRLMGLSKKGEAGYRCLKCGAAQWFPEPPQSGNECIECGHLYVQWINPEDFI